VKRFASHYIFWQTAIRLHYVEVDNNYLLKGVFPLDKELSSTAFYNGVIVVLPASSGVDERCLFESLVSIQKTMPGATVPELLARLPLIEKACLGESVALFLLKGITLPAAELCADYGSSNGYIQRL